VIPRAEDDLPVIPAQSPLILTARRDLYSSPGNRTNLAILIGDLLAPLLIQLRRRGLEATQAEARLTDTTSHTVATIVRLPAPTAELAAVLRPLLTALRDRANEEESGVWQGDDTDGAAVAEVILTAPHRPVSARTNPWPGLRSSVGESLCESRRLGDAAEAESAPSVW
jgi:hypothetical protein